MKQRNIWMSTRLSTLLLLATSCCVTSALYFGPATRRRSFGLSSATSLSNVDIGLTDYELKDAWIEQSFETNAPCPLETKTLGPEKCLIYDTTLRDGTQMESINVSCNDKLKIVRQLCEFGMMDYIECGWPGSNPKDAEFFKRALTELSSPMRQKLVAFGSTRRKHIAAHDDAQIQALLDAQTPTVCLVAKGHLWQVTDILRATPDENLHMIADSVAYLVSQNRRVYIDLEHFFDGYKHNAEYAMMCANAAANAGASGLVLCDTNGGTMPWDVERITKVVVDSQKSNNHVTVGIHCHNDCGMATANSIVAVQSGAGMIQGTVNGIGERTGNANLCTIIPSLQLHMNTTLQNPQGLVDITTLSRFVDETMNRMSNPSAPFVGLSAFAHKGGLHVAALERSPDSYQHIDPAKVGNEQRILVSELSGRQNIIGKIKEAGVELGTQINERATAILERVKTLENIGYTFEGAEASVHLMILHASGSYCPPFRVLDYSAQVFDQNMDSASRYLLDGKKKTARAATSRATIKVRTANLQNNVLQDGSNPPYIDQLEVSDGNGPVDALASALLKCLLPSNPYLKNVELVDYKVRILDPESTTGAATRVMIEFKDADSEKTWTTVSVDRNVISASLNALIDGFEYALVEYAPHCMLCFNEDMFAEE